MGITKVEELANCVIQLLSERFGKMGVLMKQRASGIDFEEVEENCRLSGNLGSAHAYILRTTLFNRFHRLL